MKFEKVSRFKDIDLPLPSRSTEEAAGYDFVVAEDVFIPSYKDIMSRLPYFPNNNTKTLQEVAELTKKYSAKVTLVSTGMKCKLHKDYYLELSVRSSTPLKHWLILANGVGIIDADYYNNPDNEGEIFFQLINLSPYTIHLKRGDKIGQGIIKPYLRTEDDAAGGKRTGGFGSTNLQVEDRNEGYNILITSLENKTKVDLLPLEKHYGIKVYHRKDATRLSSPEILEQLTKKWPSLTDNEKYALLHFLVPYYKNNVCIAYFNGGFNEDSRS